jgi:hypothetical protein
MRGCVPERSTTCEATSPSRRKLLILSPSRTSKASRGSPEPAPSETELNAVTAQATPNHRSLKLDLINSPFNA